MEWIYFYIFVITYIINRLLPSLPGYSLQTRTETYTLPFYELTIRRRLFVACALI